MFFKGLRRAGGSSPGHLVTASLTVSLSLFLPFSLFSHPSFFATLLSFVSFSLPSSLIIFFIFFSVSPFLTSFLYLDAFPDSFLLHSSLFHSLALSLDLSLFSFLFFFFTFFFFFLFIFLSFFFFFRLGEAPLRGFSAMSRLCILCIF